MTRLFLYLVGTGTKEERKEDFYALHKKKLRETYVKLFFFLNSEVVVTQNSDDHQ